MKAEGGCTVSKCSILRGFQPTCAVEFSRLSRPALRPPADMGNGNGGGVASRATIRRVTPGFLPQFYWSLGRALLKRLREPLSIFTDYAIFALTGGWVGG